MVQGLRSRFVWQNWRGKWILGRYACLGRDVINLTEINLPIFNVQKARVDYFTSCIKNDKTHTRTIEAANFFNRRDIIPLLRQQEYCSKLPRHPPSLVYMDSFSELADQIFIHKENRWRFCSCYSDLNHTDDFNGLFEEGGLLDIDKLESYYRDFFNLIRVKYGVVPIVFLHFPSSLETRPKYMERSEAILSIIEKLAREFPCLYSLNVDSKIVARPIEVVAELQDFPYHYNSATYLSFAENLRDIFKKCI